MSSCETGLLPQDVADISGRLVLRRLTKERGLRLPLVGYLMSDYSLDQCFTNWALGTQGYQGCIPGVPRIYINRFAAKELVANNTNGY